MAPEEEIPCDHVIKIPMDDNIKLTVRDYREALYEDIIRRKRI
jgi:mitogen-activated protein kinase 15